MSAANPDDAELVRRAWEARSHELNEARVGLAQAVAALTDELAERRREAAAAWAENAELRERLARAEREAATQQERAAQLARSLTVRVRSQLVRGARRLRDRTGRRGR